MSLEQAREAMEQHVDQAAPSESTHQTEAQTQETENNQESIANLDSFSKFKFQDQDLTPEELKKILTEYNELKEGSAEFNSNQKYFLNLEYDLEHIQKNPQLADKFRELYPQRFHKYLNFVLAGGSPNQAAQGASSQGSSQASLPKDVLEKLSRIDVLENRVHQADVQSANAVLDRVIDKYSKKYPLADEDSVLAQVQAKMESNPGYQMNDAAWERAFREVHEKFQKRADGFYKSQMKTQIEKGSRSIDIGPGGSAPAQPPKKASSFDEATDQLLNHLKQAR